jgi:hypothetical protein
VETVVDLEGAGGPAVGSSSRRLPLLGALTAAVAAGSSDCRRRGREL